MIKNIVFRYIKIITVFMVVCYSPTILNSLEIKRELYCHQLKKMYPWLSQKIFYRIYMWSEKNKIDSRFVCAIINKESYHRIWRPTLKKMQYAKSKSNARGLMQVMAFHYRGNPNDIYNIDLNLKLGIGYLKYCLKKARGNKAEASRMYHAGTNSNRRKYKYWKTYVKPIYNNYKKSVLLCQTSIISNYL